MKLNWQVALLFMIVLTACTSKPSVNPPTTRPMGLLKVTITGIATGASPSARAQWVQSTVNKQVATIVPVNGGSGLNDVQLTRRYVGFLDDDITGKRHIIATFDIVNRTTTTFNNLTFYAVYVPGNLGGTGVVSLAAGTGAAITDPNVARGFKPTHGMRSGVGLLKVNEDIADLQLFSPAEALNVQTQGLMIPNPFPPGGNILPAGAAVLEYGFVARNYSGGRTIALRNTGTDCNDNVCKGTITLAYQFPKVNPRNANPTTFSLNFLVANETDSHISQSLEEHTPNTVAGMGSGSVAGFNQVRTLFGSGYAGANKNDLCAVKTAVATASNAGNVYLPGTVTFAPGSLDVCFDGDGKVITQIGTGAYARSQAIQANGKIVVAGESFNGSNTDFALARYNQSGSLDTTFGTGGKVITDISSSPSTSEEIQALAIQGDGKIVAAGFSEPTNGSPKFAVARYNSNGSLDSTFGMGGKVLTDFGTDYQRAYSVAIQTDGKIVVAGYKRNGATQSTSDFAVARYNSDGSTDTAFDIDGKVTTDFTSGRDEAHALAIQGDGKIVVAGFGQIELVGGGFASGFALVRYNSDGSLDTTFDTDGKVVSDFGFIANFGYPLAIQSDGKIVVTGYSWNGSDPDFAVARYNSNGSLDSTFGTGGKVTTHFGSTSNDYSYDEAHSLAIQTDGKIVVAGQRGINPQQGSPSINDFALARYNADGSLDTTFGAGGKVIADLGSGFEIAYPIGIQGDGKIVVAGHSAFPNDGFAVARFNP